MTDLKPYLCTIRVFDPVSGETHGEYRLPVDSPDPEHAAASTLANAASFTDKTASGGSLATRSVAFACVAIADRD